MKHMIQGRINAFHVVCGSLFLVCALANLSLAGSLSEGIPSEFTEDYRNYSSGVVMVRFDLDALENREGLSGPRTQEARLRAAAQEILPGVSLRRNLGGLIDGLVSLNLPDHVGVQDSVAVFNQSTDVVCAQPSYKCRLAGTVPDDPTFGLQWQLNQEMVEGGLNVGINAMEAWDIITSTADPEDPDNKAARVMVAVLDTGVDYEHEDLGDEEWFGNPDWTGNVVRYGKFIYVPDDVNLEEDPNNIIDPEEDPNFWYYDHGADCTVEWPTELDPNDYNQDGDVIDANGHGTMVAGIIGAIGNNGIGISGVAWDVNILPVKVATNDEDTGEVLVTAEAALRGVEYAIEQGARVINMSWTTQAELPLIRNVMVNNPDIMFVCAAGDDGNNLDVNEAYPAVYAAELDNVISVLATTQTGGLLLNYEFNDDGELVTTGSNYGASTVTMGAPGENIFSLMPGNSYSRGTGTSYAAPHVSGAIALAMALNPDWTPDEIKHLLSHWNLDNPITFGSNLCQTDSRLDMYGLLRMLRPGKVIRASDPTTEYDSIGAAIDSITSQDYAIAEAILVQSDRWYFEEVRSHADGYLFRIESADIENEDYETHSPEDTFLSGYMSAYARPDDLGNPTYDNVFQLDSGESVALDPNLNAGVVGLSLVDGINAVYLDGATALVDNCLIHHNDQSGLYGDATTSTILRDCQIYDLTSSAIDLRNGSDVEIVGCTVYDNLAYYYGGGLLLHDSHGVIRSSTFSGNTAAYNSGGALAIYSSQVEIESSLFSYNSAYEWDGGAMWFYDSTASVNECRFLDNEAALDGGAIMTEADSQLTLTNNLFLENTATFSGGAMAWYDGSTGTVNNNLMVGNISLGYGGAAMYCNGSTPAISNCTFAKNDCEDANMIGSALLCEDGAQVNLTNSIMAFNGDPALGAGTRNATLNVDHCLFYKNVKGDFYSPQTGTLYTREAEDLAALDPNSAYGNPLFVPGPLSTQLGDLGNYYLGQFDAGQLVDANGLPIDINDPNNAISPAVDAGSQMASDLGMAAYSTRTDNYVYEVVDGNSIRDAGMVDLGYHYIDDASASLVILDPQVQPSTGAGSITVTTTTGINVVNAYSQIVLEANEDNEDFVFESWEIYTGAMDDPTVITENPAVIQVTGTVTIIAQFASSMVELRVNVVGGGGEFLKPTSFRTQVPRGTVVDLEVLPDDSRSYVDWNQYADEPHSIEWTNTVTMEAPFTKTRRRPDGSLQEIMEVTARLYEPNVISVQPGTDIQNAIDQADDLDIVKLDSGMYLMDYTIQLTGKNVRISGDGKGQTIIAYKREGYNDLESDVLGVTDQGFYFYLVDANSVLENLTIRGFDFANGGRGADGAASDTSWDTFHGNPGPSNYGAGVECDTASPTIRNVRFEDCGIYGGTGGNGVGGTDRFGDGGFGGWPGAGGGGGLALIDSNSVVINCDFYNCHAHGGTNGVPGARYSNAYNDGVYGGYYDASEYAAWPNHVYIIDMFDSDQIDYFAASSGVGGAVYANRGSEPKFVDCNFIDCYTEGSYLLDSVENFYRTDTVGGAVYLGGPLYRFVLDHQPSRYDDPARDNGTTTAVFENCTFENNRAYQEVLSVNQEYGLLQDNAWTGYGGALALVTGQDPNLIDCTFVMNTSTVGGGIWARRTEGVLHNCEFSQNLAYTGGGAYFDRGTPEIQGGLFEENNARVDLFSDVNSFAADRLIPTNGKGGGLRLQSANGMLQDVEFRGNTANESGGGLFIEGNCYPELRNSLFVQNTAGTDGGGVSINLEADVTIRNCTLTENTVNGTTGEGSGLGGGLYVGEYSHVDILDSILWGNYGTAGAQLAIGTTGKYISYPSAVDIDHSLIGPAYNPVDFNSLDELVAAYEAMMAERLLESQATLTTSSSIVGSSEIQTQLAASSDGTVPVIVSLKLASATEVDWNSAQSIAARQAAVATVQTQLSKAVSGSAFEVTRTLTNVPVVIGSVTANGLSTLASNDLVEHIEPVRKAYVAMSQALDLGNATDIRDMYPGDGVAVAIVDSGVDYTHPMLGNGEFPNDKVIGGYDPAEGDADPMPGLEAHGTCCAGIAAGDLGYRGDYAGGVAYDAKIYALKIGMDDANDGSLSLVAALEAWDWCLTHRDDDPDHPIKVVSNSWGVGAAQYTSADEADRDFPAYATLARELTDAGILVVAAAGNESDANSISWPSAMTDVMSVGALNDTTAEVMSYSNTGNLLDIYAPADPVYTTDIVGALGYSTGNYFDSFNGTSSATPFVAGSVASLQSSAYKRLGRYLEPNEVRAILVVTGDDTIDFKSPLIIRPRINLARAIAGFAAWPIAVDKGCQINNWVASESKWYEDWQIDWEDGQTILVDDPLFVGDYYLTQSSDENMSPAVDAGSADVNDPNVALGGTTTSIKGNVDVGLVDLGYHHEEGVMVYTIYASVVPDANDPNIANCTLDPSGIIEIVAGEQNTVVFTATPLKGYKVKAWTGTDNDNSTAVTNKVTLDRNTDITVTVEFVKASSYQLIIEAEGAGTISPEAGTYQVYDGEVITLIATPDTDYEVSSWSGTDNDNSTNEENTVTIDGTDATVKVVFAEHVYKTWKVGSDGEYQSIQEALDRAQDGDTIIVGPGTYVLGEITNDAAALAILVLDKDITVQSENPGDPDVVAQTIIDGGLFDNTSGFNFQGVVIDANATSNTVLNGFTIQNCGGRSDHGDDGEIDEDLGLIHPDGYDGYCNAGSALIVMPGASPVIKNCVIQNNRSQGGNGGDGLGADDTYNAGRGGWGGWARGGAVFIGTGASPIFQNCIIRDNVARGGNGGNGGAGTDDGGYGNYGGNYYPSFGEVLDIMPQTINLYNMANGDPNLWEVWEWSSAESWYFNFEGRSQREVLSVAEYNYVGPPRWYSGYGGGVFCSKDSVVSFIDCTISGNRTYGGVTGVGGAYANADSRPFGPLYNFEIDSYGGGVYCAEDAIVRFEGCVFADNQASSDETDNFDDDGETFDTIFQFDPYVGHGGGVCAEKTAWVTFNDCRFEDNQADVGGAVLSSRSVGSISDSNMASNIALQGAGLAVFEGYMDIEDCNLINNLANTDANDPNDDNTAALGAGLYLSQSNGVVMDCNFTGNLASGSGGAVYLTGASDPVLLNCLFHYNGALKNGGAVVASLDVRPILQNCTFAYNRAYGYRGEEGNRGYGGAVYVDQSTELNAYDSIFWKNGAEYGREIALYNDDYGVDDCPSVDLWYCNLFVDANDLFVKTQCDDLLTLHDETMSYVEDPGFVRGSLGSFYLSSNSALIDKGSNFAGSLGMVSHTTRTDGRLDAGLVDIGYHYKVTQPCRFCDLTSTSFDGKVNFIDFALMAQHWGSDYGTNYGDGTERRDNGDISLDGFVDLFDMALLSDCWLAEDNQAPTPNPAQWYARPHRTSSTTVSMSAVTAIDVWGSNVEYYFDCLSGSGHDSGWQSGSGYSDSGLSGSQNYNYRVRVRDEWGNVGQWSETATVYDTGCAAPTGAGWLDVNDVNEFGVSVVAGYLDQDENEDGVEYYFAIYEANNMAVEINDSNWIDVGIRVQPTFTFMNLRPDTKYVVRYKARSQCGNLPATDWLDYREVRTEESDDVTPPDPDPMIWSEEIDANGWDGRPHLVQVLANPMGNNYVIEMTATPDVTDDSEGLIYYQFRVFDSDGELIDDATSEWTLTTMYRWGYDEDRNAASFANILKGYRCQVRARDESWNMTDWSEINETTYVGIVLPLDQFPDDLTEDTAN